MPNTAGKKDVDETAKFRTHQEGRNLVNVSLLGERHFRGAVSKVEGDTVFLHSVLSMRAKNSFVLSKDPVSFYASDALSVTVEVYSADLLLVF